MTASQETWSKRIKQWRESGLGAKEFAAHLGVNSSQLHYWSRRLARKSASTLAPARSSAQAFPPQPPQFVELVNLAVTPPPSSPPCIEILAANGITVRVPQAFDPDTLRRVLAIVQEKP